MICPRCGNEWDLSQGPCTRCGLMIRMPGQSKPTTSSPMQKGVGSSDGLPSFKQPSGGLSSILPPNTSRPATSAPTSQRGPTPGSSSLHPPASAAFPNTPRPSATPSTPLSGASFPPTATPSNLSPRGDILGTKPTKGEAPFGQVRPQAGFPTTDVLSKNATPRTPLPPRVPRFTDPLPQDRRSAQSPLRSRRLVSDMLRDQAQHLQPPTMSQQSPGPLSQHTLNASSADTRVLFPGTILHNGRYRLYELEDRQEWAPGVFEAMWIGQDARRGASQVMICEVVLPNLGSITTQSKLRAATMALAAVGRTRSHAPYWTCSARARCDRVLSPNNRSLGTALPTGTSPGAWSHSARKHHRQAHRLRVRPYAFLNCANQGCNTVHHRYRTHVAIYRPRTGSWCGGCAL